MSPCRALRRPGHDRGGRGGGGSGKARALFDLAGEGAQRRARLVGHLLVEKTLELLVLAKRRARLARSVQQADQIVLRLFAQRLHGNGAARVGEGAFKVACLFPLANEPGCRIKK